MAFKLKTIINGILSKLKNTYHGKEKIVSSRKLKTY